MSTAKAKKPKQAPRRPEKKYGPFAGGAGVVVWLNEVQTDSGVRYFRSYVVYLLMWPSRVFRSPRKSLAKAAFRWQCAPLASLARF